MVDRSLRNGHAEEVSDQLLGAVEGHVLQALAGAVLLRDRLAEADDHEGTQLALLTVAALNNVLDDLSLPHPTGLAQMLMQDDAPPMPGFAPSL